MVKKTTRRGAPVPRNPKGIKKRARLTQPRRQFCEYYVEHGENGAEACEFVGYPRNYAPRLLRDEAVMEYIAELKRARAELKAKEIVEQEHKIETEQRITKARIVARLWTLASLPPTDTNGTITGQVKAADAIGELMGYKIQLRADLTKDFEGRSELELEFFAQHGYWPNTVDPNQSRPN